MAANKTYLSQLDKQVLISRLANGESKTLAKELGYSQHKNFLAAVRRKLGKVVDEDITSPKEVERKPIVELPPVNLLEYRAKEVKEGDEEIAILHTSDGHADKITPSYNKEIYRKRMETMYQSAMVIVKLHRKMYPINKLLILNTGDNAQGENPYQGSVAGGISMGARDQVKKLAAPMWNDVIGSFKQNFVEVEFHGVPGNHGHDQLSAETSSYDLLLYDILEAGIGQQKGIKVNIHENWWAIVNAFGFKLFMFHGDGIPCQQGIPFFAIDRKLKSWHMQFGGFDYAFSGHFHKAYSNEISSQLEHFMCGSLVSDDEWAQKKLGISSMPSQWIMGLHPKQGITWRYHLIVDRDYSSHSISKGVGSGG